jgi:hypothetical protein
MRWKRIFSLKNRLANLFEVIEKSFSRFHRKLLVLRISDRFSIAIYSSRVIEFEEEAAVGNECSYLHFRIHKARALLAIAYSGRAMNLCSTSIIRRFNCSTATAGTLLFGSGNRLSMMPLSDKSRAKPTARVSATDGC